MCGIVGVVRRRSQRSAPAVEHLLAPVDQALVELADPEAVTAELLVAEAERLERVDALLRGTPGLQTILAHPALTAELHERLAGLGACLDALEARLDAEATDVVAGVGLERVNAALIRLRDVVWAIDVDRLRHAAAVAQLAGPSPSVAALDAYGSIQAALSSIDRLEVRGRDSAGLEIVVRGHALDLHDAATRRRLDARSGDPLFRSGSVRVAGGQLAFVVKAAAEIGELGDNTAVLRAAIAADDLLRDAVSGPGAEAIVLGHTRWASVGIISEANAHPLDQDETDDHGAGARVDGRYVAGVLNGDVDNHTDLEVSEQLEIAPEITTDAKLIPVLVHRRLQADDDALEAFRSTVATLEGSLAIGATISDVPDRLFLSLRGSGQALYVGLADDAFVVASEPYGLVEETARYVRIDGETPADPDRAAATRGQIVVLDAAGAGTVEGIVRTAFDGTPVPVGADDISTAEITTRDIDRGDAPHFLLKEISESPDSFRKTLRGKVVERDGRLHVTLGDDSLPARLRARLRDGAVRRIVVIGQGTAAVAGQSLAGVLSRLVGARARVDAIHATELSGFELDDDMSDALVIAISQSGTTTDTNRTADVARARGATILAIVNRRNSDLVDKSDGVVYTSDGRDVEMAVPSTKAFYAQIAAGHVLALALAEEMGATDPDSLDAMLRGLRDLPDAMRVVLGRRKEIAVAAQRHALSRRYWAIVGNGVNRTAAQEVRIKLSELCYKSIACDVTEDKKHIDLSAEPLIIVCAAGLEGSNADDVAKEIEIYRAHRAAPIVIATDGERRFQAALEVLTVPAVAPQLAFVLSAMVGHLFGYEAALAIDASALPLRAARSSIAEALDDGVLELDEFDALGRALLPPSATFLDGLRAAAYDGNLEASTAVRLASLLRYVTGIVPLDLYQLEHGKVGTPSTVVEDLTAALTDAIDELTRPIDAIKHQAKTVTVGISRSDEGLLDVPLVRAVLDAGAPRDSLSYRALRTLVALDDAVDGVTGFTRYRIEGDVDADADASIFVVDRGGVAASITSVTDRDPRLRGTKHRAAAQREVTVARGRDGRTIVLVPEVKDNEAVGITLLHAAFEPQLPSEVARTVLQGYQGRYGALKDAVTESVPDFDDAVLAELDPFELLTEPVRVLAGRWPRP